MYSSILITGNLYIYKSHTDGDENCALTREIYLVLWNSGLEIHEPLQFQAD